MIIIKMIYKYITMNNMFIFVLSISTWYTFYSNIKTLHNKYEMDNDWLYEKIVSLEKQIDKNKELITYLENRVNKQNELIDIIYQENTKPFFSNNLKIINPNIFCENKSFYFNQICKSPYVLENSISTSSRTSTNKKNLSPTSEDDWTNVGITTNEYNI